MAKTIPQVIAEINATIIDNTVGDITPAELRQNLNDMLGGGVGADGTTVLFGDGTWKLGNSGITGPTGPAGPTGPTGPAGSMAAAGVGTPVFGLASGAQSVVITSPINNIQLLGNVFAGDNGGGAYTRVSSLPPQYAGNAISTAPIPPSLVTGGLPVLVFATTGAAEYGPTVVPIFAGDFVFVLGVDIYGPTSPNTPPATFQDSVGNVYTRAVYANPASHPWSVIYYCVNPLPVPVGASFNLTGITLSGGAIWVYTVRGFKNAVLDVTAATFNTSGTATSVSLPTGMVTVAPALVVAIAMNGGNPMVNGVGAPATYPAGWFDLAGPQSLQYVNPMACAIVPITPGITFAPMWSGGRYVSSVLAVFNTAPNPIPFPVITPGYWQLVPTKPVHTAQYGIVPSTPNSVIDNMIPFQAFGRWLASTADISYTSRGSLLDTSGNITYTHSVTISIANPAIVTLVSSFNVLPNIRNGLAVRFETTGALPAPFLPDTTYYVQYGTVTYVNDNTVTFELSTQSIFDGVGHSDAGQDTNFKGSPISTAGSTQSGTHYISTYGDSWVDFVLDPGLYYSSINQAPGPGVGLRRWRMYGSGARFQTPVFISSVPWSDINSASPNTGLAYQAAIQTTVSDGSGQVFSVTLVTPSQAANFYVNSWALIKALEIMGSSNSSNWNEWHFEYVRIKSVNTSTGVITFFDSLQNRYKSTYPVYPAGSAGGPASPAGTPPNGAAAIVQLSETFDQEIEIHGVNFNSSIEQNFQGVKSMTLVDCEVFGWQNDTGPYPSTMKRFVMRRCNGHWYVPEIDKMIDYMECSDCVFDQVSYLKFQSATINKLVIERCRMVRMDGTPRDMTLRNSYISGVWSLGVVYGVVERIYIENSHVALISNILQAGQASPVYYSGLSFSGGTLRVASGTSNSWSGTWNPTIPCSCPLFWSVPGGKIVVRSTLSTTGGLHVDKTLGIIAAFTVLDTYVDGSSNYCVDTDLATLPSCNITVNGTITGSVMNVTSITLPTGWPTGISPPCLLYGMGVSGAGVPAGTTISVDLGVPNTTGNLGNYTLSNSVTGTVFGPFMVTANSTMYFLAHPAPRFTAINCTGGSLMTDWTDAPPDIPLYSYFKRAFTGLSLGGTGYPSYALLCGNLKSWTVDVQKPYTGSSSTYSCTIYMFGWVSVGGSIYPTYVTQVINTAIVAVRTITATGTSTPLTGDTLASVPFFLTGGQLISIATPAGGIGTGDTLANMPRVVMTAQADQGIDWGTTVVNTTTSGRDVLADSRPQSAFVGL